MNPTPRGLYCQPLWKSLPYTISKQACSGHNEAQGSAQTQNKRNQYSIYLQSAVPIILGLVIRGRTLALLISGALADNKSKKREHTSFSPPPLDLGATQRRSVGRAPSVGVSTATQTGWEINVSYKLLRYKPRTRGPAYYSV